ncbi:Vitamin B12 import ATP-binding protein BtuD [Austwickia sp. TVS 96-490-7B]|uniref:dipeptide/oligopeptide/nickel ABC transporter permease/ATP-binding protein n=1 Tax=Austwickia sp. TVS 96-490-7B TaxID=2830843 RepID=UPI001C562457|nr:dipeptide/oligopeptide/nickel ABC transporter permease/ATP-binding protein [Austwickia sp. TVS 96-490-7B]MBW3086887.1 Vitamin B12 import ATP-binding protein BtuD [Austwickia sp. TVS 96-490-7B]
MRRALTSRLESSAGGRLAGLRTLPLSSQIAVGFLSLIVLAALCAPLVAGDPLATGTPVQWPGAEHLFGTDAIGRDVFARVVWGARSSLAIGLAATGAALAAAAVLGSVAATAGKATSEILMRVLDIVMSFPGIALAAVFVAVFGNALPVLILAIGFLYVPQLSRVVRANVIAQFGEDYVAANRVMGARIPSILLRHVARNCVAPIMVFATVLVADAIVFEASLSFINAGVKPPHPSWGNILADGKQVLLSGFWWPTFFPGLMILLTVLSLNILAEGLTDTLASPARRRRVAVPTDDTAATPSPTAADDPAPGGATVLGVTDEAHAQALLDHNLELLRTSEQARTDRHLSNPDPAPLLSVQDLRITFPHAHGDVPLVDGVSFDVRPGETMGLVGESGCGKSITSMAVMGLLPADTQITGRIMFDGRDLLTLTPHEHNALRGHDIAMIYQDALSALNPSMLIRSQLAQLTRRGGRRSAEELLELVGLDPARTLKSYPHELSGGQRQRVLIAMALTRNPRLIIADEPTTALDVTVQQQVVDLLERLRHELGFAMVFVSHDLALVAQLAHRVTVMYAGQVVEQGGLRDVLTDPRHEYTRGLLGAVLSIESGADRLHHVRGTVPSPADFVAGDRFAPRSSHPTLGLDEKPRLRPVPGLAGAPVDHRYAATDELLAATDGAVR